MDSPSSSSGHRSEDEGEVESDDDDYSRPLERSLSVTTGASALLGLFQAAGADAGTVEKSGAYTWTNGAAGEDVTTTEQNTVSLALLADPNASKERATIIDTVLPMLQIAAVDANQGQSPEVDLSFGQQTAGCEDDQLANYHLATTSRATSSRDELTEWT